MQISTQATGPTYWSLTPDSMNSVYVVVVNEKRKPEGLGMGIGHGQCQGDSIGAKLLGRGCKDETHWSKKLQPQGILSRLYQRKTEIPAI